MTDNEGIEGKRQDSEANLLKKIPTFPYGFKSYILWGQLHLPDTEFFVIRILYNHDYDF